MDPVNPSCPKELNWSTYRQMRFTLDTSNGLRVLRAEGLIDEDMPARLGDALKAHQPEEIWLRSPGGGITMAGRLATQVAAEPRVHLLGYGPSASTIGANRAGRAAVAELLGTLAATAATAPDSPATSPSPDSAARD